MGIVILLHILMTFVVIYLIQAHIPWRRGSLAKHFELRHSIDFLLRCATPVVGSPDKNCLDQWQDKVEKVSQNASELGVDGSSIDQIRFIKYPDFLEDHKNREAAHRLFFDVATSYDREWTRKNSGYLTAVVSGGWIVGILSIGYLIYLTLFYKNIRTHLILPLFEIMQAFAEWKSGNRLRRCQPKDNGRDFKILMDTVNELFDEKLMFKKNRF